MDKRCILVLPYFGKFKNYFKMFLMSCGSNDKIDWLIISDQKCPVNYKNIRWLNMEFLEFRLLVQKKFNFKISLETPYKLCDYKPAYGYILEDYIKGYDYWGHCDCDLIFGNLNKMLVPLLNQNYDKMFAAGHLTIYKNTYENNRRFMNKSEKGVSLYNVAFSNKNIFGFDEDYYRENVHVLFQNNQCKIFDEDLSFNISTKFYNIFREYYNFKKHIWETELLGTNLLIWDGRNVFNFSRHKGELRKKSYLYAHLQMRNMKNTLFPNQNCYVKICPENFEKISNLPEKLIEWKQEKKLYFSFEILKRFLRGRYYTVKSLGKSVKDIDSYNDFL